MKQIFKWAGLFLLAAALISCGSPASEPVEEVQDEVPTRVVEAEEAEVEEVAEEEPEPEEEMAMDEEMEVEEASMVEAVDGPTHEPATTVEQAIQERSYDQAKGGEEPLLTIIEYGDFQ